MPRLGYAWRLRLWKTDEKNKIKKKNKDENKIEQMQECVYYTQSLKQKIKNYYLSIDRNLPFYIWLNNQAFKILNKRYI